MNKESLRIVFFGTAPFATACLERLVEDGYNVVSVVTAPDKPAGRGHKLQSSAVKICAEQLSLPILQPESLRDPLFIAQLKQLNPTLGVVVAFRMLPREVWALPEWGTVNIHGSLLPHYRGAAPINWALIRGEKETGVTLFQLKHEIDTGDIIAASSCEIQSEDNFGTLYDRLMSMGADLLGYGVQLLLQYDGDYPNRLPQGDAAGLSSAPKLTKENTRIDWYSSAEDIHNMVRGLAPAPTAWTILHTPESEEPLSVKLYHTTILNSHLDAPKQVGSLLSPSKGVLAVQTGNGLLQIDELKVQGKKQLSARDWLNGLKAPLDQLILE